jgi:hypothetical protein
VAEKFEAAIVDRFVEGLGVYLESCALVSMRVCVWKEEGVLLKSV